MAGSKSWVVTDVQRSRWEESRFLGHDDLQVPDCTVSKRTLRGGLCDGVDIIDVNNGELSFSVLPTRGMGIGRASYRGVDIGWKSPVKGPVHPKFVNAVDRGGLGWLQGFDELLCRCGLESNGAPGEDVIIDNNGNEARVLLTLHGKIANLPAHYVEIQSDPETQTVSVIGHVDESAIFLPGLRLKTKISTSPVSNRISIVDEIENLRSTPAELELLYHWNFGQPFLDKGSRLLAPVKEVAPRATEPSAGWDVYEGPTSGWVEQVYFFELLGNDRGDSLASLRNGAGDHAVTLRFNTNQLPRFTQWKNTGAVKDSYVTGIEPGTNYPNVKRFEREKGRVVRIDPGKSYVVASSMEAAITKEDVAKIQGEVDALQRRQAPVVHPKAIAKYSPV